MSFVLTLGGGAITFVVSHLVGVATEREGYDMAKCSECERVFDLFDETDAAEWHYGHDCESDGGES
jgi:hypothetical protein